METGLLALALGWVLQQAITGFACNRSDAFITAACQFGFKGFIHYLKSGNLPVNHDLQKAVRRSLLKAQKAIAEDYQEELGAWFPTFGQYSPFNKQRDNLRWVNRKLEHLNRELKQVNNAEYEEMSAELLDEIGLLLTPEGILNAERIAETKQQLLEAVLQGDEPAEFEEKLKRDRDGLFDLLCANFADEIKNNQRISGIFDSQLLAQINSKLTREPVTLEELENCLSNVNFYLKEIGQKQDELLQKLDKWGERIGVDIRNIQPPTPRQVVRPNNTRYGSKLFVGRDRDLDNLHQTLQQCDRVAVTAIAGMGGIGKSELTIQYAHRYGEFYPGGIWFFDGASGNLESQILVELAQLNLGLDIPQTVGNSPLTLAQQVQWCWNNWPIADRVLLVWDDIAELESILELLPREPRFRVLLTTRNLQLAGNFTPISLDVLLPEKALELLQELTRDTRIESESTAAENLCKWLGYLPLGIELVGRYLALDPDLSVAEMWERLQAQSLEDEAIDLPQSSMMTAQRGVKAAIELSWRKLDRGVADVARLLGVFAPAAIAWDWVKSVAKLWNGWETEVDNARK